MIKNRKIYYIIFTFFVTLLFVYLKFPSDSVKEYTLLKLNESTIPFKVDISSASLKVPPGISYGNIFIGNENFRSKISDHINIYPSFLSLFDKFRLTGDLLGGEIDSLFSKSGSSAQGILRKIKIARIPFEKIPRIPKGLLFSGLADIDFKFDKKGNTSDGRIDVKIEKLVINLPNLPVKNVSIDTVDSNCLIKNDTLLINKMDISGVDFTASIIGSVHRADFLENCRINLNIIINPKASALKKYGKLIPLKIIMGKKSKISFRLSGTINKPVFRL